jgi:hypothetical protein
MGCGATNFGLQAAVFLQKLVPIADMVCVEQIVKFTQIHPKVVDLRVGRVGRDGLVQDWPGWAWGKLTVIRRSRNIKNPLHHIGVTGFS